MKGALEFKERKAKFEDELLAIMERDHGKFATNDELAKRKYFCSALIVACYAAVGVIDATAQLAYRAEAFSPGDLHRDDTFGWFADSETTISQST